MPIQGAQRTDLCGPDVEQELFLGQIMTVHTQQTITAGTRLGNGSKNIVSPEHASGDDGRLSDRQRPCPVTEFEHTSWNEAYEDSHTCFVEDKGGDLVRCFQRFATLDQNT